ncbi:hypothetical protein BRADI_1g47037v3 [Brachypodium distachyon]|uniref:Uncharacterized protein n=1 Tax=Brachypodium distachyon TaxID=15368 RepID=A0A2K2DPW8_BRADI|nr:hypothetical protein BRADI_1g47037v3 [Brachypodium distachyon]
MRAASAWEGVHEAVWEGRVEVREDVVQGESDELAPAKKDAPEKMVNVEGVGEVDDSALLDDAASSGPLVDAVHPDGALREVVEASVEEEGDLRVEKETALYADPNLSWDACKYIQSTHVAYYEAKHGRSSRYQKMLQCLVWELGRNLTYWVWHTVVL